MEAGFCIVLLIWRSNWKAPFLPRKGAATKTRFSVSSVPIKLQTGDSLGEYARSYQALSGFPAQVRTGHED